MDPLDFLDAVLRRPRLDPHAAAASAAASASSSSASAMHHGGGGSGSGAAGAAFPTSAPFMATGGGPGAALPSPAAMGLVLKLAADLLDRDQPGLLEGAVETLDRAPVRRIVTRQYRRELHVVKGRERIDYTVLGRRDCSCQAFAQDQARSASPRCKHVLAVRLAGALGRLEEQEVADDGYEAYTQLGYAM